MTDSMRVLQLFRKSGGKLISNATILAGQFYGTKPIATYTARITDARDLIGCNCGIDEAICSAQEHIRNMKKNWYRYVGQEQIKPEIEAPIHVDITELEKRLTTLRGLYTAETLPWRKKILEVQGRALRASYDLELRTRQVRGALT